ncbi:MAG: glycosyltransferase family 1 protein [Pyrinomonadaceae bacterium]
MNNETPRVALFTDAFHEVDGVSHTCRQLKSFVIRRELPFFCTNAGKETKLERDGSVTTLELKRGAFAFKLDQELGFDIALWRYRDFVKKQVAEFRPDIIHITGPGDFGQMGMFAAKALKLPLVISWHTNVHEFAGRRLDNLLRFLPARKPLIRATERAVLAAVLRFHKEACTLLAPNDELCEMLERATGIETAIMSRGVDTHLFDPAKRDVNDGVFRIGYVGRLRPEKNVRLFAEVERALLDSGKSNFLLTIIGEGTERESLEANLRHKELPGFLRGEALSRAYANMDVFAFTSETDTFGNVVLEALASGVPCVVTGGGGPKFIVKDTVNGFVAKTENDFAEAVKKLISDKKLHAQMCVAARAAACEQSWDSVFEKVYEAYKKAARKSKPESAPVSQEPNRIAETRL